MEKAIVSTSLGCEGISVANEEHLLIADTPEAFARSVIQLIKDPQRSVSLGKQGRALVEKHYSWVSIIQGIEDFYHRMCG